VPGNWVGFDAPAAGKGRRSNGPARSSGKPRAR
jgi:hypothetical protein